MSDQLNLREPLEKALFKIDDLYEENEYLVNLEKTIRDTFFTIDTKRLKESLRQWVAKGAAPISLVYEIPMKMPERKGHFYLCSDGTQRETWPYILYCIQMPIEEYILLLNKVVEGIIFTYSFVESPNFIFRFHCSKQ